MPDAMTPEELDALVAVAWRAHHIAEWGDDLDPRDNGQAESGPIREALVAVFALLPAWEYEYAVEWSRERGATYESTWSGWAWRGDLAGAESFARAHLDGRVLRRRAPGATEELPRVKS